jgi:hypothetical protein
VNLLETNIPQPNQLDEILQTGLEISNAQLKTVKLGRKPDVIFFLPRAVEEICEYGDYLVPKVFTSHRFTGRTALTGENTQRMRLAEAAWRHDYSAGSDQGYRISYEFEWSPEAVIVAAKRIHRRADSFTKLPDKFESVSRIHCQNLLKTMEKYCSESTEAYLDERPSIIDIIHEEAA